MFSFIFVSFCVGKREVDIWTFDVKALLQSAEIVGALFVPFLGAGEHIKAYAVANRADCDTALVSCAIFARLCEQDRRIQELCVGISSVSNRRLSRIDSLRGRTWDRGIVRALQNALLKEFDSPLVIDAKHEFTLALIQGFVLKFDISVASSSGSINVGTDSQGPTDEPATLRELSANGSLRGPTTSSRQIFERPLIDALLTQKLTAQTGDVISPERESPRPSIVVGTPLMTFSAFEQVAYTLHFV